MKHMFVQDNFALTFPKTDTIVLFREKFPKGFIWNNCFLTAEGLGYSRTSNKMIELEYLLSDNVKNSPSVNLADCEIKQVGALTFLPEVSLIYDKNLYDIIERPYYVAPNEVGGTMPIVRLGKRDFIWLNKEECEKGQENYMTCISCNPWPMFSSPTEFLKEQNERFAKNLGKNEDLQKSLYHHVLHSKIEFNIDEETYEDDLFIDTDYSSRSIELGWHATPKDQISTLFKQLENNEITIEKFKNNCANLMAAAKEAPDFFSVNEMMEITDFFKNEMQAHKERKAQKVAEEQKKREAAENDFLNVLEEIE